MKAPDEEAKSRRSGRARAGANSPISTLIWTGSRTWIDLSVVVVTLEQHQRLGRGEAAGVFYLNDDVPAIVKQIEEVRDAIERGIDRMPLQKLLLPGGARNALDCAFWDLEAQLSGRPIWEIAGLDPPKSLLTTFTCGAAEPEQMAATARKYTSARAIKLKLTGDCVDGDRVRAVREARQDVWLAVDGNQSLTRDSLDRLMPVLMDMGVALIEQPFPVGQDVLLEDLRVPIVIAADESVQGLSDVPGLVGRFNVANIKLEWRPD